VPSPEPQRREVTVGGVRISFLEWGAPQPDLASILILHGLVAAAKTFNLLAAQLAARHVIALDMPGSGYSERPLNSDASFSGLAHLVMQFAAELKVDRPILIGHSHGGAVALRLAQTSPSWAHGLILMSPAHPYSHKEDRLVRFYLSPAGRAFANLLPRLPRWLHLFAFKRMPGKRAHFGYQEIAPYVQTLRAPGTIAYMLRLLTTWESDMNQLRNDLEAAPLNVPTLLLWGDRDIVVPVATANPLVAHLKKRWEMFTLPGVGHLPNEEAPKDCADLIKTWLIWRDTHWLYADT
jgi:pimeloyl-ACP methyl ester carboxylesterase